MKICNSEHAADTMIEQRCAHAEHNIGTGVKAASTLLSGTLNCVSAVHLFHILVICLTILGFSNFDILSNVPSNLLLLTNDEEHLFFENKSWRDRHVITTYYNGALTWWSFVYIDNGMEFCVYRWHNWRTLHNTMMRRPLALAITHPPPRARHLGRPRSPQHSSAFLQPGVLLEKLM